MAKKKSKKRLFSGMSYHDVQRSNSARREKLPKQEQKWLKESGYRNVGWDNVIKLYQKINDLIAQPQSEESTLEELFLEADRIGNKYQTQEERADFEQQLSAEVSEISTLIDKQFPDPEFEFTDYSSQSQSKMKRKRR
ncbi:MAG: hypothetical protein F6K42_30720 [Leptolyngbya sp. SIO1D8]|nr:hypothetical protein [Leptolyngbya sp. SIO1D8]